jgi:SagB-type dehydrogenase family enzyme
VHWRRGQLILEQYAGATQIEASPLVLDVLDRFTDWEPIDTVARQFPRVPADLLRTLIDALVQHGALETSGARQDAAPKRGTVPGAWDSWHSWSPAASYFHHSTKDVAFTPRDETIARLKARAVRDPIPPPLKPPYPGKRIALPPPRRAGVAPEPAAQPALTAQAASVTRAASAGRAASATGAPATPASPAFPEVLLGRRTWRRFGARALQIEELATLLGLTWGVQAWMDVEGWGKMPLKTAPSGGARHSIEAYVLARRVDGLTPGLYHYQPASHALHAIRTTTSRASRADILAYLPRQAFYGSASALVLMSAVFPRVQWRYAFPRAYRTVLAEAGHHCQTFCLVATWLGLAPFCTMALADSRIERDLQIDGVSESVLYAAGVGPRPAGTTWAPWARTTDTPTRTPNPLGRTGDASRASHPRASRPPGAPATRQRDPRGPGRNR